MRERDINEPFIYLEHRDGRELRIACSVEDAPGTFSLIKGWIARPATFPAPPPALTGAVLWPLFWAAFALASLAAAWAGVSGYSSVVGWAYTSHFFGGMTLSLAVLTAVCLTVSLNPLRLGDYLLASPLLIAMTLVFTSAGMYVNARFGARERIEVRGRVVAMDDDSFTAYFSRGKGRGLNAVPISLWRISVQNEADGKIHRIEVPGWVASRDKLSVGCQWEDRYYRGALGWTYRIGPKTAGWDGFDFVPRVTPAS